MNSTQPLTHKEMTKHLRHRIKVAGIKARVAMAESCGTKFIKVDVPTYEGNFTEDEQRTIRTIAQINRLTWVYGMPIDTEQMTNPKRFEFQF